MDLTHAIDIARAHKNGILTTQRRDGRPQLSNIIYTVDDNGLIRISITADRAKAKNLARLPQASLYVGREDFWAYVVLDADVELSPVAATVDDATVEELIGTYRAMAGEHKDWDEYRRSMVDDKRLVARLRPTHAYGMWSDA
jgi:PPOX class probable F420-dependent enzyme